MSLHYHLIWATHDRLPLLQKGWINTLHEYLGGCVRAVGGHPEGIGGVADHVHLLVALKPVLSVADV